MDILEQTGLPCSLEAERLLLGAGIVDPELQGAILNDVQASDFSLDSHKIIFEAMRVCYGDVGEFDRVILTNYLHSTGELASAGGMTALMYLDENTPRSLNWAGYSRIVKEKAALRRGIIACQSLISQIAMGIRPSDELLSAAAKIQEVLGAAKSETQSASDIIERNGFDGLFSGAADSEGIRLPWASLSEIVPVLRPGNLVIVAAGTGYGKSSFARQIALDAVLKQGRGAFIASYEMSSDEVLIACACTHADVNGWKVDTGYASDWEKIKLRESVGDLKESPLYLFDGAPTIATLEAEIRKCSAKLAVRDQKLGVVIVDYLQLMDAGRRVNGETERVAIVARGLKNMAARLNLPIVALSQFARPERGKVYSGEDMMLMLKNSSEIEQAANVVIILEPAKIEYDVQAGPPKTLPYTVHVTKQRKGPKGMKTMLFDRAVTRFRDEEKNVERLLI